MPIIDCISVYFIQFLKNKFNYIFFLSFFIIKLGASQDYAYKNYSTKDGLAGDHVYHAVQDKEGYLWFATETGVSRFDGKNFVNYTVNEGLPSNEILKLFVDSKGRVWMMPFANKLCYYYKGKIFNATNDSILNLMQIKTIVIDIIEDSRNNLIFKEIKNNLIGLSPKNKIYLFQSNSIDFHSIGIGKNKQPQIFLRNYNSKIIRQKTELYNIIFTKNAIELTKVEQQYDFLCDKTGDALITPSLIITTNRKKEKLIPTAFIFHLLDQKESTYSRNAGLNNINLLNDSLIFINTDSGTISYDFLNQIVINKYLTSENVTNAFSDNEKNIWFTTANHGVYKLCSTDILNFIWKNENNNFSTITSVGGTDKSVFIGNTRGEFWALKKNKDLINLKKEMTINFLKGMNQKIKYKQNRLIILDQMSFLIFNKGKFSNIEISDKRYFSIKDFDMSNKDRIFISYHSGACYGDLKIKGNSFQLNKFQYFYNSRTTSITIADSIVYLGTLSGLKSFDHEGNIINKLPNLPLLKVSVSNLVYKNGLLWIGTNQNGVICFDGKKIIRNITFQDGLPDNSIRCMYIDGSKLIVGTSKGLAEISFTDLKEIKVIRKYDINDGLVSSVINDLFVLKDTIYVATEEGLSIITKPKINQHGECLLNTPIIKVGSKVISGQNINLNPGEDIEFEYVGISFKSEGDILYKYRLIGLDTTWKTTNLTDINFSYLPYGNYHFELMAINKFGIQSRIINVPFLVKKKLYEETYFRLSLLFLLIIMIWSLYQIRVKRNKLHYTNKLQNAQKIMELEQEALKAQMNPHFIFNCLNAIQHYIFEKDVMSANKFISSFAGLIRQALDNSGRKNISLEEEIIFLKSYIEIEQNRFEDKFYYSIKVEEQLDTISLQIPPMLIQPFVENAINHGLLHKKNEKGNLVIDFSKLDDMLKIIISDNGIGRVAAKSFSSYKELLHVSKGIQLTQSRINKLNDSENNKIRMTIEDKYDTIGNSTGTQVELFIPLFCKN